MKTTLHHNTIHIPNSRLLVRVDFKGQGTVPQKWNREAIRKVLRAYLEQSN